MPPYILSSASLINAQSSASYCNDTYLQTDPVKAARCEGALNGILSGGVQAAILYMMKELTQYSINYNADLSKITEQWLNNAMEDPISNQMVDLLVFFLRDGFHKMQDSIL